MSVNIPVSQEMSRGGNQDLIFVISPIILFLMLKMYPNSKIVEILGHCCHYNKVLKFSDDCADYNQTQSSSKGTYLMVKR